MPTTNNNNDIFVWHGNREQLSTFMWEFESMCGSSEGKCIELLKGELHDPSGFPEFDIKTVDADAIESPQDHGWGVRSLSKISFLGA